MYKLALEKEKNLIIFFDLVESFLANAPQLLLQLYILIYLYDVSDVKCTYLNDFSIVFYRDLSLVFKGISLLFL
jgi:hypothetical protein